MFGKNHILGFLLITIAFLAINSTFLPVLAPPTVGTNVDVTNNSYDQNEPNVAFNPLNNQKLVVGYNDYRTGAWKLGWSWSDNGGSTWTFGGDFSVLGYSRGANPIVAFDNAGTCYYAGLVYNPHVSGFGQDGSIFLAKSNDGGHSFTVFQKIVAAGSGITPDLDRPWMSVNPVNNHVYLTWVRRMNAWTGYPTEKMTIWFTRSVDGGATFSTPIQVGGDLSTTTYPCSHGPQVATGPGSTVYVSWHTSEIGTIGTATWKPPKIWISQSTDDGVTFGTSYLVVTKQNSYPAMFISMGTYPPSGRIYIAYAERPTYPGDLDIYVATATSVAGPWTIRRVNDDAVGNGASQFWPSLDVAPNGRVDVIWYDFRAGSNYCNVYYSASTNGGSTWEANTKITSVSPGYTPASGYAGDFVGTIASLNEKSQAVWGDNRLGNQEVYTATLTIPAPPPASFSDGFESGSFSAWTGTGVSTGETAGVINTLRHHGTYSAMFTSNGNGGTEVAYCYKTVDSSSELYARGYFTSATSGIVDDYDRSYFLVFKAGANKVAFAGWKRTGGVVKWSLIIRDGTSLIGAYSATSPSLNKWYCVELHWKKDASGGLGELYVNGAKVCSITGKNTAAYGDVNRVEFGLPEIVNCGATAFYGDCARIATTYIGPEAFSFADGFERGSFGAWTGTGASLGEKAVVTNTKSHHGLYSALFTSDGGGGTEYAYCYKTLSPSQFEVYARGYFLSTSAIKGGSVRFMRLWSGRNIVATLGLTYVPILPSGGVWKWQLRVRDGATWVSTTGVITAPPITKPWLCVELHWKEDPVNGLAEMWQNGVKVCSITGKNTAAYGDVSRVDFGLPEILGCTSAIALYCDCIAISNTYIKPEP